MPAEWEPHSATWLTWPRNTTTWPGKMLKEVEGIYLEMITALLPGEKVHLLLDDIALQGSLLAALKKKKAPLKNLEIHPVPAVDTWIRDYGPIFVKKQKAQKKAQSIAFTKWIFNAWGGKYKDLAEDNGVVDKVSYLKGFKRFEAGIILEGGSIDMNGRGTCLTTEQCLFNPNRNRHLSRRQIEGYLKNYLGAHKVIWLKDGIEGDDTDGHIDDITRFVGPRTVITVMESNKTDNNYSRLKTNLDILTRETDQDGRKLNILELPMPGKVGVGRNDDSSERLPASYANFYIGNKVVLLPVYSHANDKKAIQVLKKVFPSRRIVAIESTALVYGLGSIHCVTQQQPK